jgi:chorismate dehydratase
LPPESLEKPKVCAVSYLNTAPLVWGMLYGPQRDRFELEFRIPAACADQVACGAADIGIVPSFELTRQHLNILPGTGIACHGPVRSILLVSKYPASKIRRVAMDSSSRTSVQLARIVLAERYGVHPECISRPPDLDSMLQVADAALIIGDPALRIDPATLAYPTYDLGAEWTEMTGLPMVFAVWAGRREAVTPEIADAFRASCEYGLEHIHEIVALESARRHFAPALVYEYLTARIVHRLGPEDYRGLQRFLDMARKLNPSAASQPAVV